MKDTVIYSTRFGIFDAYEGCFLTDIALSTIQYHTEEPEILNKSLWFFYSQPMSISTFAHVQSWTNVLTPTQPQCDS